MKLNFGVNHCKQIINDVVGSREFRKKYGGKLSGILSDKQIVALAEELWKMIAAAYADTIPSANGDDFTLSDISISTPTNSSGGMSVVIKVNESTLHRYSLLRDPNTPGEYTGKGVYDIFGLLTRGYHTKTVVGCWADKQGVAKDMGYILSLKSRSPNPFIRDAVSAFVSKHSGVEVKLPELWK